MHNFIHTDNSLYYISVAFLLVVHVFVFGFSTKHNNLMLGYLQIIILYYNNRNLCSFNNVYIEHYVNALGK